MDPEVVRRLRDPRRYGTLTGDIEALLADWERLREALAEWHKHDSAPDCVACCVLDAELNGPVKFIPDGEEP